MVHRKKFIILNENKNDNKTDVIRSFFEYYDQYITDAEFAVYSPQDPNTPIIHNKYYELYPINVGGIQTSWESQDSPLTLSVEFEFYYMQSLVDNDVQMIPSRSVFPTT